MTDSILTQNRAYGVLLRFRCNPDAETCPVKNLYGLIFKVSSLSRFIPQIEALVLSQYRCSHFDSKEDTLEFRLGVCPDSHLSSTSLQEQMERDLDAVHLSPFAEFSILGRDIYLPASKAIEENPESVLISPLSPEEERVLHLYNENMQGISLGRPREGVLADHEKGAAVYRRLIYGDKFLDVTVHKGARRLDLRFMWIASVEKMSR